MIVGGFSTFMTHFSHFRVWWRFEGAAKTAKNDQKCSFFLKTAGKHTHIARITHQNGPKHPENRVRFFVFLHFFDILPKMINLEILGHFRSFSTIRGRCKTCKKCPNMPKLPKNCKKPHTYCPDYPPKWA